MVSDFKSYSDSILTEAYPKTIGMIPVNRRPDNWVMITPPEGSAIRCSHCNSVAACVSGDNLIVVQRHHGNYHKSVISLEALGYVHVLNTKA